MISARDYIESIKALIIKNSQITRWNIIREESHGKVGLYRFRFVFIDLSELELFERFEVKDDIVSIHKYSYHWQDASGKLIKRWDNAPHHPEIATFPHHVHEETDKHVNEHSAMKAEIIIEMITSNLTGKN